MSRPGTTECYFETEDKTVLTEIRRLTPDNKRVMTQRVRNFTMDSGTSNMITTFKNIIAQRTGHLISVKSLKTALVTVPRGGIRVGPGD